MQFTKDIAKNNLIYLFSYEGLPHLQMLINECIPEQFKIGEDEDVKKIDLPKKNNDSNRDNNHLHISIEENANTIPMSMEIFNVKICIDLMALCCEGKSEQAEKRCHSDIINMKVAAHLYQSSGRFWPMKNCLVNYVNQCYLDSSNDDLFSSNNMLENVAPLKQLVLKITNDLSVILEEWHMDHLDCIIQLPDNQTTSF